MSGLLLAGIAGLALLDSANPATLVTVTLILLAPGDRKVAHALAFVAGAFLTVAVAGLALFGAADLAAEVIGSGLQWLRRIALAAAATALFVAGVRRWRPRTRSAVALPGWFSPWTALPLGVVMTGADLPNAFPYFIALERLVAAGAGAVDASLVILGYAAIYCLPCLLLLAVGVRHGAAVRARLSRVYDRFGAAGEVPRNRPAALLLVAAAGAVGALAAAG